MNSPTPRITEKPANGRKQAQRTALSDSRMLEAAVKLIVERGTEKTTLKEVGELAGYSRGLAGYRFGTKVGLFEFVVKAIGEEWLRELREVTEGRVGLDAIRAATDAHYRFCVEAPEHVRAFYMLWFESIGPGSEFKRVIAAIHARRQRDVVEWIEKAKSSGQLAPSLDADAVASQFGASIIGIVYQWLLAPEELARVKQLHSDLIYTMQSLLQKATPAGGTR